MTRETRTENLDANVELTDSELNAVTGGTPKETKTPPEKKAIEIQDFSFGVTMPVTTS